MATRGRKQGYLAMSEPRLQSMTGDAAGAEVTEGSWLEGASRDPKLDTGIYEQPRHIILTLLTTFNHFYLIVEDQQQVVLH